MFKTYTIDPTTVKITTAKHDNFEALSDSLRDTLSQWFTTAGFFPCGDRLMINEIAPRLPEFENHIFEVDHHPKPIHGKGFIYGIDYLGLQAPAESDEDWLAWNVRLVKEYSKSKGVITSVPFAKRPEPGAVIVD